MCSSDLRAKRYNFPPVTKKTTWSQRGKGIYEVNCVACHQTSGQGITGIFPALAGSDIVMNNKDRNIEILMEGVQGAAMNSFSYLSEVELAAVITYTRQSWGNEDKGDGEIVIPKDIVESIKKKRKCKESEREWIKKIKSKKLVEVRRK